MGHISHLLTGRDSPYVCMLLPRPISVDAKSAPLKPKPGIVG